MEKRKERRIKTLAQGNVVLGAPFSREVGDEKRKLYSHSPWCD